MAQQSQPRAFSVESSSKDDRIPQLLVILSTIITLQKQNRIQPKRIWLHPNVYVAVSAYFDSIDTTALFGIPVQVNLDKDCMPFVIESDGYEHEQQ